MYGDFDKLYYNVFKKFQIDREKLDKINIDEIILKYKIKKIK